MAPDRWKHKIHSVTQLLGRTDVTIWRKERNNAIDDDYGDDDDRDDNDDDDNVDDDEDNDNDDDNDEWSWSRLRISSTLDPPLAVLFYLQVSEFALVNTSNTIAVFLQCYLFLCTFSMEPELRSVPHAMNQGRCSLR